MRREFLLICWTPTGKAPGKLGASLKPHHFADLFFTHDSVHPRTVKCLVRYVFGEGVWRDIGALEGQLNPEQCLWLTLNDKVGLVNF